MNRKKFFGIIGGAVAIAAVAGAASSSANNTPKMSDLTIKNLEILTQNEGWEVRVCQVNYVAICFYDQYGPVPGTRVY
ncbi:MAG: hypothetical protein LBU97_04750 [Alistipes sp.]|jgi:hypothetical protein|nr:hypothetical protein [Alistipes sp.]